MQTELTMRERLDRFEIAQETIGFMIAIRTDAIYDEEKKANPDRGKIAQWKAEKRQFADELYELGLNDDAAIQHVLDDYCPIVKADYEQSRAKHV